MSDELKALLLDLIDDVEDYAASNVFRECHREARANLLKRAREFMASDSATSARDAALVRLTAEQERLGLYDAAPSAVEQDAAPWISTKDRMPAEGQSVAFVTRSNSEHEHGRVLGGTFHTVAEMAWFSVPGVSYFASHWIPLPAAPVAAIAAQQGARNDG
nr:DUF551 domain-containing protein [Paraburkholderia sp. BL8N3]